MAESMLHVAADAVPWEDVEPGIRRKVLGHNDTVLMALIAFRAGAVGAAHTHPHTQITYVQDGVFDVTIDGETKRMRRGDGFLIPSGKLHGVVAVEDGVLVDVFTPTREDFLTAGD